MKKEKLHKGWVRFLCFFNDLKGVIATVSYFGFLVLLAELDLEYGLGIKNYVVGAIATGIVVTYIGLIGTAIYSAKHGHLLWGSAKSDV